MSPLRMIVLTDDAERFRGALTLAAAHAALGGDVTLFLQLDAVRLLHPDMVAPCDETHAAAGLPSLTQLRADALALGVKLLACQSGLALSGLDLATMEDGISASGPLAFLQSVHADDRLVAI